MRFHRFQVEDYQETFGEIFVDLDAVVAVYKHAENRTFIKFGPQAEKVLVVGSCHDIVRLVSPPAAPDTYEADLAGFGAASARTAGRPVKAAHRPWEIAQAPSEQLRRLAESPPTPEQEEFDKNPTEANLQKLKDAAIKRLEAAAPDGFKDQRRRTEALNKARLFELALLRKWGLQFKAPEWLHPSSIVDYCDRRMAELEGKA